MGGQQAILSCLEHQHISRQVGTFSTVVNNIYFKVARGSEAGLVQRDDTIKMGTLGCNVRLLKSDLARLQVTFRSLY